MDNSLILVREIPFFENKEGFWGEVGKFFFVWEEDLGLGATTCPKLNKNPHQKFFCGEDFVNYNVRF